MAENVISIDTAKSCPSIGNGKVTPSVQKKEQGSATQGVPDWDRDRTIDEASQGIWSTWSS